MALGATKQGSAKCYWFVGTNLHVEVYSLAALTIVGNFHYRPPTTGDVVKIATNHSPKMTLVSTQSGDGDCVWEIGGNNTRRGTISLAALIVQKK